MGWSKNPSLKPKKMWKERCLGNLETFFVRCDEPMKRSKEATGGFRCTHDCRRCFCGIIGIVGYRNEHHVTYNEKEKLYI